MTAARSDFVYGSIFFPSAIDGKLNVEWVGIYSKSQSNQSMFWFHTFPSFTVLLSTASIMLQIAWTLMALSQSTDKYFLWGAYTETDGQESIEEVVEKKEPKNVKHAKCHAFFLYFQSRYIYIVTSGAQLSVPAHELKDPLACGDRPTEAGTVDGRWLLTTDDSSLLLLVKMLPRTSKNHALYVKTISSVPFTRESQVARRFDHFYHISCRMSTGEHTFVRIMRFSIFIIIEPFYLQNVVSNNAHEHQDPHCPVTITSIITSTMTNTIALESNKPPQPQPSPAPGPE